MIIRNIKSGLMYHVTRRAWDMMTDKGLSKLYKIEPTDLPPIPPPPVPEELIVRCCGGQPCINDVCTEERAIEEPLTVQDIEGETPKPKRSNRTNKQ